MQYWIGFFCSEPGIKENLDVREQFGEGLFQKNIVIIELLPLI